MKTKSQEWFNSVLEKPRSTCVNYTKLTVGFYFLVSLLFLSSCFVCIKLSLPRRRSYGFVTQSFLPHECLLWPVATSVQANWPITGRLPLFVKWDFDLKFISRVHVNMANIASVLDLVSQKFCIRELNALQKKAIIQFVEKQRDVFY